jgi:hypothetical protein
MKDEDIILWAEKFTFQELSPEMQEFVCSTLSSAEQYTILRSAIVQSSLELQRQLLSMPSPVQAAPPGLHQALQKKKKIYNFISYKVPVWQMISGMAACLVFAFLVGTQPRLKDIRHIVDTVYTTALPGMMPAIDTQAAIKTYSAKKNKALRRAMQNQQDTILRSAAFIDDRHMLPPNNTLNGLQNIKFSTNQRRGISAMDNDITKRFSYRSSKIDQIE